MKNKIVMITAALAVMMAMTGIAAANPFNLNIIGGTNPLELAPGTSTILDLEAYAFTSDDINASTQFTYTYKVDCVTPGCDVSKVVATFPISTTITAASGTVSQPNNLKVEVLSSGTVGHKYLLTVTAGPNGAWSETGVATRGIDSIPEFATVAIPIAAVLGLVFFFQQRKKKEE